MRLRSRRLQKQKQKKGGTHLALLSPHTHAHPMRPATARIAPLADGLALLSLGQGREGSLDWELSCGCSVPSAAAAATAAVGRPRFSPAVRATSGAGASTSTWTVTGEPITRRAGDMRGGALFQVRR